MTCSATTSDIISRILADVAAFDGVDVSEASSPTVSNLLGRVTSIESWASAAQALLISRADTLARPPRPGPPPPPDSESDRAGDAGTGQPEPESEEPEPEPGSGPSAQDQLTGEAKLSEAEARRKRRRADLLKQLPGFHAALVAGRVTVEHIDAIADLLFRATPRERTEIIELANSSGLEEIAAQQSVEEFTTTLGKILDGLREETPDQRLARQRLLSFLNIWENDDGMTVINGELDPEMGNRFREMIEADLGTVWAANRGKTFPIPDGVRNKHGWLRAQVLLQRLTGTIPAGANTAANTTSTDTDDTAEVGADQPDAPHTTTNTNSTDSNSAAGGSEPAGPVTGVTLGPPAELVLFADYHKLTNRLSTIRGEPVGWFGDGTPVGVATIRRLACDAYVLPMIFHPNGEPLDNARRSRTANRVQRRALQKVYGGCMFCRTPFNWCQIHHFWHWLDYGPSQLWNLGPLCGTHHHQVHDNGHQITRNPDKTLNLQTASGRVIATTSVAHPQPPVELNIASDYQPPPGTKRKRHTKTGRTTNTGLEPETGQKPLTNTAPWPTETPPDQHQPPTRDPNPSLF